MFRRICAVLTLAAVVLAAVPATGAQAREVLKDDRGLSVWTRRALEMKLKASGDIADVATVELWYRPEGGAWARWDGAALPDETPGVYRVKFTAPQTGVYEFFSVSVDKDGNSDAAPTAESKPMMTIHFDYEFPEITLAFADNGTTVAPGGKIRFDWSATDASLKSTRIVYYFQGEKIDAVSLALPGTSGSHAIDVPTEGVETVTVYMVAEDVGGLKTVSKKKTFRVVAAPAAPKEIGEPLPAEPRGTTEVTPVQPEPENEDDESETATKPPTAPRAEAPTPGTNDALKVTLRYDVTTVGLSGLDRVELWVALVEGEEWQTKNWTLYETTREAKGEFVFVPQRVGQYAFYIIAGNRAGLWSRPRPDGRTLIEADYTKWLDDREPTLQILSPGPEDVFRGGARIDVRWRAQDNNLLDLPIKIELLRDGKPVGTLAEATENSGEFAFDAPRTPGSYAIRMTAADRAGHATVVTSEPFVVDTCQPKVTIEIIDENGLPLPNAAEADEEKSCAPDEGETDETSETPDTKEKATTPEPAENTVEAGECLRRGMTLMREGKVDAATTELARAAELAPGDDKILNEYGIALYTAKRYAEARENFTRAVELSPGEARYRWNIFLCNYALKDADGAAASALGLLKTNGAWDEAYAMIDAVVALYQSAGKTDEAAAFLKNVLAVENLSEKVRQHAQSKLQ